MLLHWCLFRRRKFITSKMCIKNYWSPLRQNLSFIFFPKLFLFAARQVWVCWRRNWRTWGCAFRQRLRWTSFHNEDTGHNPDYSRAAAGADPSIFHPWPRVLAPVWRPGWRWWTLRGSCASLSWAPVCSTEMCNGENIRSAGASSHLAAEIFSASHVLFEFGTFDPVFGGVVSFSFLLCALAAYRFVYF